MNAIELDYEPRKIIMPRLTPCEGEPEMSEFQSAFLCGLLKKYKPHKLMEVGIAGGATSAIIMQSLYLNDIKDYHMYSIDLSLNYYRGGIERNSGFLIEEAAKILDKENNHKVLLGHCMPYFADQYGSDVDFILLDTAHCLPGEILDFLAILPCLKEDAIVCLHDVDVNMKNPLQINDIAPNVLFRSVAAEKYYMFDNEKPSNIGAFRINADTYKYIENVFGSLMINWSYIPDQEQMQLYDKCIKDNYTNEQYKMFKTAQHYNTNTTAPIKSRIRKIGKILIKGKV